MSVREDDKDRFEELDEQRRRVDDEFNFLVQRIRSERIRDPDRMRIEVQQLHVRHEGILREMVDLAI